MEKTTYVFIDGSYVRAALDGAMMEVFGVPGDLALEGIGPSDAFRVYFYDCIDETKANSETETDFAARIERLSRPALRPGLHIRLGTLSRGPKRTQKEVDVLLAVDMLTHGFNRNMSHAILVTGDLDFRPVVEALVRGGVFVEVWYEKRSAAKELPAAADFGREITWGQLYSWNSQSFRVKYYPPGVGTAHGPVGGRLRSGLYGGRKVELLKPSAQSQFILRAELHDGIWWFEHPDKGVLERYFTMTHGTIEWTRVEHAEA